ncbi:plasmid mobilization relaxosome protein MobC [Proteus mirabilis]|nr:plasmid mobilization relaxosome protein MobC [Proteus mirabilis]EFB5403052.1 MobC family plasmid mobilization relaxosome protein [Escherichia coli]EFB5403170.1 MobC family plasmid mobilization relaxosome protein [Escherichia coli]MDL4066299.1 plasmid mobilization relaxosome protein MobC [Proteus mirabilis]MDM3678900.1 plasmid mobilization relaxosome protein MobC [Proteus mirabilis]MDM3737031.1 plasmid mobilization relaxosome protein MobC [Proteus mirabilis]
MQKKRNIKITVRYSDEELEQAQANSQGVFASWLRSLSLNEKTKKIKPVDPQLLYELNRIGVNLNQIARYCNQQAIFQAEDKIDLLATLANIEEQLQALRESHAS